MRVLVAEDDPLVREMVCEALERVGLTIGDAGTYDVARSLMTCAPWDVLLTDMLFSELRTGLDLAAEAAGHGIHCIVIMSGAGERCAEIEGRGIRFLAKPFHLAELLAAVAFDDPSPVRSRVMRRMTNKEFLAHCEGVLASGQDTMLPAQVARLLRLAGKQEIAGIWGTLPPRDGITVPNGDLAMATHAARMRLDSRA